METVISPTSIPPTRPSRSNSLSSKKDEIITTTNEAPRKLSFDVDPRASSYSSSSSSSSSTADARMSFASVSSDGNDIEDGEGEDDDTLDDDVWVSRRFTMLLSPATIQAINNLSSSRTTFHVPTQTPKASSTPSHHSIAPIHSKSSQPPQPQLQKHQENGTHTSASVSSVSSPTESNTTGKTFVSPRNIPPSVRHAQTVPPINPITNGKVSPRSESTPTPSTPSTSTPNSTVPPRTSPRGSTSSIPSSNGAPKVSPRSSVPVPTTPTNSTHSNPTPTSPTTTTSPATSKAKPPTAPRSNSNRGLTVSFPTPASPITEHSTPSTPSTPADVAADNGAKKRVPHTPPNKPLPPNPKKAAPRIYTKEEQNRAARIIQNNYRIFHGKKIHEQAVAIYRFRTHVANEILNTEKTYVSVLRHVVTRYYEPLVKNMSAIGLDNEDVKIIFGGIPVLLNINSNMLKDLQSRMDSWSATQCLGDLFLNMAAYLKIYTEYVKNFDLALRKIDKCSKNPQFEAFLLAAEDNDEKRVSLESYLITPVQRIPRYVLLLQQLYDHTPTTHVDYPSLGKAITQIRDVASYINEKKREADNALRVVEIQSLLTGKGIPRLVNAQRRFCAEGDIFLYLKGGKHKKKRYFFLFNDILALTKPIIVQTIFTKKKKYRYKFKISLQSAELGESNIAEHSFCINTSGQSWVFGSETAEGKNQWVSSLKANIESLRSSSQNYEERVSKISQQKATNARAAITKQYTTLRSNSKLTSSASLPIPNSPTSPTATSPTSHSQSAKGTIPILDLDEKDMAELGQRKILSDALTRLLRSGKQAKSNSGDHPERAFSAPNINANSKQEFKKSKSLVDVMAIKSIVLQELVEKVAVK